MQIVTRLGMGIALLVGLSAAAYAAGIDGDYIETRSADVYTGPCFANGEVGLLGNQAILGWKVREGRWGNVSLDGLTVVGVVRAGATLGDVYSDPYPAKAVLFVDQAANDEQRAALVEFAKSMGGRLLENVVEVKVAPISLEVGADGQHGSAVLTAGNLVTVRTRSLSHKDHFCGNEITYYPPLTGNLSHAMPVFALANEYAGNALDTQWRLHNRRSAFLGTFATNRGRTTISALQ